MIRKIQAQKQYGHKYCVQIFTYDTDIPETLELSQKWRTLMESSGYDTFDMSLSEFYQSEPIRGAFATIH